MMNYVSTVEFQSLRVMINQRLWYLALAVCELARLELRTRLVKAHWIQDSPASLTFQTPRKSKTFAH